MRAIDLLVVRGQMELVETGLIKLLIYNRVIDQIILNIFLSDQYLAEIWKQRNHIMNFFESKPKKSSDFLNNFYNN